MAPCTRPGMKRFFCLKAKTCLGRFAPSGLPHNDGETGRLLALWLDLFHEAEVRPWFNIYEVLDRQLTSRSHQLSNASDLTAVANSVVERSGSYAKITESGKNSPRRTRLS